MALDFGAESGRTIVGRFDGDQLSIEPVHRYPNTPVRMGGTLYWDFPRQFGDILGGLERAAVDGPVASVAVDTWGVDYGFIDARGRLLANPVHYRDTRHEKMPEIAFETVPRAEIYAATGIQFMSINTLFQLLSEVRAQDPLLDQADRLLMMPDLLNHFLCGSVVAEYTEATTSQCLDPWTRDWARPLFERLGIPTHFLPEVVPPGTILGELLPGVAEQTGLSGTRVVAAAAHDTASAVAGTPLAGPSTAYISSGTWSLVGLEVPDPVVDERALAANVTNEGGYGGTITLLKNVMGLWFVQQCRSALWSPDERPSYEELSTMTAAGRSGTAFVDPTDGRFLWPGDMPARVREFCAETGQPAAAGHADPAAGHPRIAGPPLCRRLRRAAVRHGPAHRADPHRGRRRPQHAALPADGGCQRPAGGGRARGGHGHRQHRHPGHRGRRAAGHRPGSRAHRPLVPDPDLRAVGRLVGGSRQVRGHAGLAFADMRRA